MNHSVRYKFDGAAVAQDDTFRMVVSEVLRTFVSDGLLFLR